MRSSVSGRRSRRLWGRTETRDLPDNGSHYFRLVLRCKGKNVTSQRYVLHVPPRDADNRDFRLELAEAYHARLRPAMFGGANR